MAALPNILSGDDAASAFIRFDAPPAPILGTDSYGV